MKTTTMTLKAKAMETTSVKNNLVESGKKGVSNKQMIAAMVEHQDSKENLQQLFSDFTEVFKASAKYTPDITKAKLEELVRSNEGEEDFRVKPMGKKVRALLDNGTPAAEIEAKLAEGKAPKTGIEFAETFEVPNNEKLANLVKANDDWKSVLSEDVINMVIMAVKDTPTAEIAEKVGLKKDSVYSKLFRKSNKNAVVNLIA